VQKVWFLRVLLLAELANLLHRHVLPAGVGRREMWSPVIFNARRAGNVDFSQFFAVVPYFFLVLDHGEKSDARRPNIESDHVLLAEPTLFSHVCHHSPLRRARDHVVQAFVPRQSKQLRLLVDLQASLLLVKTALLRDIFKLETVSDLPPFLLLLHVALFEVGVLRAESPSLLSP